ncbi:hypothetical protein HNY73_014169 [Argiope bruennichi]|uniref:Uncharacterized protein n=1 Tax=Argiope bruennichi TaxID=94029 RepID=A0A8T0ES43_ARGBR|nr:hypothetical protein HNY73_014169 [Argiope bruennichi]
MWCIPAVVGQFLGGDRPPLLSTLLYLIIGYFTCAQSLALSSLHNIFTESEKLVLLGSNKSVLKRRFPNRLHHLTADQNVDLIDINPAGLNALLLPFGTEIADQESS